MNDTELAELRQRVEEMQQHNDGRLQALQTRGIGVDKSMVVNVRFAILVDTLLGDMDAEPRLRYELACQEKFSELIDQVESQVTRAQLLQGVQLGPPPNDLGGNGRGGGRG